MQTAQPSIYVFDSSALINLERRNVLRILDNLGERARIPDRVALEVSKKRSSPLAQWVQRNQTNVTRFIGGGGSESETYLKLLQSGLGDGEASAFAIAQRRRWILVIDDGRAREEAEALDVECLSMQEFLNLPLSTGFY